MSKTSDATLITSLNTDDQLYMLRPVGPAFTNVRVAVSVLLAEFFDLLGDDTIPWDSILKTGSDILDLANRSHTSLTSIGTNTHTQIDSFIAAYSNGKVITFAPIESIYPIAIADGTIAFTVPALLNGYNLSAAIASVHTPGTGTGAVAIQIRRRRIGTDADMLSTKITISVNEYFAADGVINTSYDDVLTGDQIYVDVDQLTTVPPNGLSIALTFTP